MPLRGADRRLVSQTIALAGLALLCLSARHGLAETQAPELSEIIPSSGPAGEAYPLPATIRGTGFLPTGNIVNFGPVTIPDLSSADGTQLAFMIPKKRPSGGEVPPMPLPPGEYQVTVKTAAGVSNALVFTLTGGG
jgi:hypothetical protein